MQSPNTTDETFDEQQARSVVSPLLTNAYEAFAFTDESVIYDTLARSADGEVLDRLYRDIYASMIVSDHDRGRAIIADVTPTGVELLDADDVSFTVRASWNATGSVYHWGHSHERTYAYTAEITSSVVDDAWKMTALTVTDQERLIDEDELDLPDAELPEEFRFEGLEL